MWSCTAPGYSDSDRGCRSLSLPCRGHFAGSSWGWLYPGCRIFEHELRKRNCSLPAASPEWPRPVSCAKEKKINLSPSHQFTDKLILILVVTPATCAGSLQFTSFTTHADWFFHIKPTSCLTLLVLEKETFMMSKLRPRDLISDSQIFLSHCVIGVWRSLRWLRPACFSSQVANFSNLNRAWISDLSIRLSVLLWYRKSQISTARTQRKICNTRVSDRLDVKEVQMVIWKENELERYAHDNRKTEGITKSNWSMMNSQTHWMQSKVTDQSEAEHTVYSDLFVRSVPEINTTAFHVIVLKCFQRNSTFITWLAHLWAHMRGINLAKEKVDLMVKMPSERRRLPNWLKSTALRNCWDRGSCGEQSDLRQRRALRICSEKSRDESESEPSVVMNLC